MSGQQERRGGLGLREKLLHAMGSTQAARNESREPDQVAGEYLDTGGLMYPLPIIPPRAGPELNLGTQNYSAGKNGPMAPWPAASRFVYHVLIAAIQRAGKWTG